MAFRWAEFLKVARSLEAKGDEGSLRASVSRAYYAAFGETRELLEKERGKQFPADSVHQAVLDSLDGSYVPQRMVLASNLKSLKGQRVRADYRSEVTVELRDAAKAIEDARLLLADLEIIKGADGNQNPAGAT